MNLSPWAAISMFSLLLLFLSMSFAYACHITPCTSLAQSSPKKKKKKDTLSLVDVKGIGRPKEFAGKEGKFPAVLEEKGSVLCWSPRSCWSGQLSRW